MTIRVGIAGHGVVGKRRGISIDANPGMEIIAVSDIHYDADGVTPEGIPAHHAYESLFSHDLDALFVSLPNYLAAEATIAGLQHGLHVFCEKPPGRNVEETKAVIDEEQKHPELRLKYGFNHRYHRSVQEAKRLIDSGELGPVLNLRGVYGKSRIIPFAGGWRSERDQAGGGILLDQGIHMLDLVRYFAGDFEEVQSFVSNAFWHHDVEDNAYALMRSSSGAIAMVHSSATQWRHRFRLEVTLRDGLIELAGILSGTKSYGEERLLVARRDEDSDTGSFHEETTMYLDDNSWQEEVDEFAALVLAGEPVTNGSSHDALKVMEMVYRVYNADPAWRDAFMSKPLGRPDTSR
jgi:predicted dehydrogenase